MYVAVSSENGTEVCVMNIPGPSSSISMYALGAQSEPSAVGKTIKAISRSSPPTHNKDVLPCLFVSNADLNPPGSTEYALFSQFFAESLAVDFTLSKKPMSVKN